jgi:hypothetical protein
MLNQLCKLPIVKVGHSDRADEPGVLEALHARPGLADVGLGDGGGVDQVEVDVGDTEL